MNIYVSILCSVAKESWESVKKTAFVKFKEALGSEKKTWGRFFFSANFGELTNLCNHAHV